MANNVIAQVVGGKKTLMEDGVSTVGDVRKALGIGANYQGAIEGVAQPDTASLSDGQFVSFSEQVKGA